MSEKCHTNNNNNNNNNSDNPLTSRRTNGVDDVKITLLESIAVVLASFLSRKRFRPAIGNVPLLYPEATNATEALELLLRLYLSEILLIW